jgi:CheY-like chemotaxis protein
MQIGEHDLGVLVTDILAMLRPMLDERIEVRLDLAPGPMIFEGDAGMIEQVVTNLCLNARDAMPVGGRLTFRTRPAELPDLLGTEPGSRLREGYVLLEVMDTGTGMDEEVKRHLFEPFFTTKSVGRGSGLGLATVHGIVSQHGGHIDVSSRVGVGSTFAVYLPRSEADPLEAEAPRPESVTDAGSAVLLVEDDPEMQLAMLRGLRRIGHRVVAASSGVQALDVWERFDGAFDVLVTDQVMPGGLSGDSLADLLCQRRPGLGVVIVSGYAAEPGGAPASWRSRYAVLAKPVTLAQLVLAIQRSLPAQPT